MHGETAKFKEEPSLKIQSEKKEKSNGLVIRDSLYEGVEKEHHICTGFAGFSLSSF
jgi:hypothetical protein